MTTTFLLYGRLGEVIGHEWQLDVSTLGEGIRAIEILSKKLVRYLLEGDQLGIQYGIKVNEQECKEESELKLRLKEGAKVEIFPIIAGAGGEWWHYLVAGVALIALSFIPGLGTLTLYGATTVGSLMFSMGIALTFAGLARLLSPSPEGIDTQPDKSSSSFSGQVNTSQQGAPVPLAYGELMIGSQIINMVVKAVDAPL